MYSPSSVCDEFQFKVGVLTLQLQPTLNKKCVTKPIKNSVLRISPNLIHCSEYEVSRGTVTLLHHDKYLLNSMTYIKVNLAEKKKM